MTFFSGDNYPIILEKPDQDSDRYETISIESKIREGVFHKVVKDLETGNAVSCSCKCWSKGNKACFGMKTIGFSN
jgi:hypothetical protein